jgi:uncharacterized cupredoxin-like copper-binding protein
MSTRARVLKEQQRARQRRRFMVGVVAVVVILAVIVVVGAMAGDDGRTSAGAGDGVTVSMTEFAFAPDPIEVTGEDAQLHIVNDGQVVHDLVIPTLGKGTPDVQAGAEFDLDLTDQPPGTYRVICDIPGHVEAGMETELTIG